MSPNRVNQQWVPPPDVPQSGFVAQFPAQLFRSRSSEIQLWPSFISVWGHRTILIILPYLRLAWVSSRGLTATSRLTLDVWDTLALCPTLLLAAAWAKVHRWDYRGVCSYGIRVWPTLVSALEDKSQAFPHHLKLARQSKSKATHSL